MGATRKLVKVNCIPSFLMPKYAKNCFQWQLKGQAQLFYSFKAWNLKCFWNRQFLSYKNVIYLKRKLRTIVIQIWNKIRDFCTKKIEKKSISRFSILKVKNFCDHSMILWEMTGHFLTDRWIPTPPPGFLGLNHLLIKPQTLLANFHILSKWSKRVSKWVSVWFVTCLYRRISCSCDSVVGPSQLVPARIHNRSLLYNQISTL